MSRRRRARTAVAVVFFVNGALFASLVPRYPELKARLGLSNAAFGAALAAFPLGALMAGLFAGRLIRRFRSAKVAALGLVLLAVTMPCVAAVPNGIALGAVLLVAGGLDAVIDVAQNVHGLRVQRLYGRSIVNAFHGVWSTGAVAGGVVGAAAAGLAVPLAVHLIAASAFFSAVALVAYRFLLPGPEDAERAMRRVGGGTGTGGGPRVSRRTVGVLVALGALAACGALVEDAGASWGALYLRTELGAAAASAGMAYVVFQAAMTTGRLVGDRVVDRVGRRVVVRVGGVVAAAGMGFGLAVPTIGTTLVGYGLAGLGVATLVPAAMHSADELRGLPTGVGLTVVSWLLRVGFLVSSPAVGAVADAAGLRAGLLSVVAAGVLVAALGRVLEG